LTTMRIGLISCVEATILGREWCYAQSLVHSKCLIETQWLILYGFRLQVAIPETLYFY
jgi:hypothetical protein